MGCKLVQGETVYFVRHEGASTEEVAGSWYSEQVDSALLPCVYAQGKRLSAMSPSVVPIEIRIFTA
jgi:hypothetical protein